jgi:hypothetical protein
MSPNKISVDPGSAPNTASDGGPSVVPLVASSSGASVADLPAGAELLSVPSHLTPSLQGRIAESDDVDTGASQSRPKRGRSPESEDSEYVPNKRSRLRLDPTRTLRYVRPTIFSEN